MLQARSQWRSYSNLMIEKLVVEAAAEAEAQDFAHRIKAEMRGSLTDIAPGDTVPTGVNKNQLFSSNPFRRVEIRGGVSRTASTGAAPLLFDPPSQAEQAEMVASDVGMQPNIGSNDESLRLPVFWVPKGAGGAGETPPRQIQLGVDDPYGDIFSRSSYAAVSSYSKPRKAFFSEGARVGFGNAVSIHARTFPVSAFTAMSFDPSTEIAYYSGAGDYGRVYSGGRVGIYSGGAFERITALRGVGSGAQGLSGNSMRMASTSSGSYEISDDPDDDPDDDRGGDPDDDRGEEPDDDRGGDRPRKGKGGGVVVVPGGGDKDDIEGGDDDDAVVEEEDLEEVLEKGGRKELRGVVVGASNGAMELVRNQHVSTIEELATTMIPHIDCDIEFDVVQKLVGENTTRKTLGIKSGGLKLKVDPAKAVDTSSLRVIDGGDGTELSPDDLISGKWRRDVGDGAGGSAFYAETIPGTGTGKLYFNPCRLRFIGGDSSRGKPFSIRVSPPAGWRLYIVTERGLGVDPQAAPGDGITIVSGGRALGFELLGSFITSNTSTPSMLVGQNIAARPWPETATSSQSLVIGATVVTKGASPTACILGDPSKVSLVTVRGGAIVWEEGAGTYLVTVPTAPPKGGVEDPAAESYRIGLLSGSIAPSLVPVVSEVRINGNAPFTRRGAIAAKFPGTPRPGGSE
jgi:hypothetical protein